MEQNNMDMKKPYYGYDKRLFPKLKNWGYMPPSMPKDYPFQSNAWFNHMRDYAPQLGGSQQLGAVPNIEKEAAALTKNLLWVSIGTGVAGFLAYRYLL